MRICHLSYDDIGNPWLGGGGALRAREIYRRLAARHEITVVCGGYPGAAAEEKVDGIRFLRTGSARSYAGSRLAYCRTAPGRLRELSWDVWVNEFSAFAPLRTPAYLRRRGILFFYHFVGAHALAKHPLVGGVSWAAERWALRAYSNIVTISPSMQEQVRSRLRSRLWLRRPPSTIDCVYSGVDPSCFELMPSEGDYLLYFGRVDVHTKGLDTLVAAFASLAPRHPGLRLRLAGRGRQQEIARLGRLVEASGAAGQVELVGAVDERTKGELLAGALFVCAPSRYEGWCIAAVEASAAGKAVLGTEIDGLRDAVRAGETGLLVPPGDPEALAAGMTQLLANADRRQRLGEAGRAWARRFDWDRIAGEQEAVFERVAAANATLS